MPEFSRPIAVDSLGEGRDFVLDIHASTEERAALAHRFDLVALDSLTATVSATRTAKGDVRMAGRLKATVAQTCVVTLEPVPATIETGFTRLFSRAAALDNREEIVLALEDDEPPEPLVGDMVDVGEVVAETLGLALDPFPRAPGATLPPLASGIDGKENIPEKLGTFAALAKFKKRR